MTSTSTATIAGAVGIRSSGSGVTSRTTGLVVSATVIVNRLPSVAFAGLVARQPTVVVPGANIPPESTAAPSCTSPSTKPVMTKHCTVNAPSRKVDALTVNGTAAPAELVASALMLEGTMTTGGSITLTVNVFVGLWLPCASVARQETVVGPIGNVEPEEGVHDGVMAP